MPTSKKRINVTLKKDTAVFLQFISLRDDVPPATKAAQLIEQALELEEDAELSRIGDERASQNVTYIPDSDAAWGL